jgi:hypothetical protein
MSRTSAYEAGRELAQVADQPGRSHRAGPFPAGLIE